MLAASRLPPRKDYAKYSDIEPLSRFFYKDDYEKIVAAGLPFNPSYSHDFLCKLLLDFADGMAYGADESTWWNGVKEIAAHNGFAINNKDYKENPSAYKGSVSDAAEALRIALTGVKQSPNLHEVIEILGQAETKRRLYELAK